MTNPDDKAETTSTTEYKRDKAADRLAQALGDGTMPGPKFSAIGRKKDSSGSHVVIEAVQTEEPNAVHFARAVC